MKVTFYFLFVLSVCTQGCSFSNIAWVYPVDGPVSKIKPPLAFAASSDGFLQDSAEIYMVLAGDETCSGRKIPVVKDKKVSDMSGAWKKVYGYRLPEGGIDGANKSRAKLVCNKGTEVEIEYLVKTGAGHGFGIATDNKGNTYKIKF